MSEEDALVRGPGRGTLESVNLLFLMLILGKEGGNEDSYLIDEQVRNLITARTNLERARRNP